MVFIIVILLVFVIDASHHHELKTNDAFFCVETACEKILGLNVVKEQNCQSKMLKVSFSTTVGAKQPTSTPSTGSASVLGAKTTKGSIKITSFLKPMGVSNNIEDKDEASENNVCLKIKQFHINKQVRVVVVIDKAIVTTPKREKFEVLCHLAYEFEYRVFLAYIFGVYEADTDSIDFSVLIWVIVNKTFINSFALIDLSILFLIFSGLW